MPRLRNLLLSFLILAGIAVLVFIFSLRDRYVVPILTYHHVSDAKGLPRLNNVTPRSFAWQMKFIKKHRYNVISFDDYIQGVKKGNSFARNIVIIQFDDGYDDNYTEAFPVLKQYKFPAMIFLISDKINDSGFLTWDQVKEMEAGNFKAGAHTRHHVYLPDASADVAKDEIFGSKKIIEGHLGHAIDYFAYPSGGFNETAEGFVEQAGFLAAGTTNRGQDRFNRNLFEINRIRVKDSDNGPILWAKLSGYYNLFREPKCGSQKCDQIDVK
jgi:peptidoglycan/xylan/chitin deacetylase (PgdA/CDA1 family)